jgi:hypothetical protein
MTQYLITFGAHAMVHIPDEDMPDVAKDAHAVCQEAINAGVLVFAGGLLDEKASIVATDGTVTDGPDPEAIGGFTLIEVPSRQEALQWAARVAAACRCAQEVWQTGPDPEVGGMPGHESHGMTRYLISFGAHAMDHFPEEDMPAVSKAAHAKTRESISAGVFVCTGALQDEKATIVASDGTVTDGPAPEAIGGFSVIEVPSRGEALQWAAKQAAACRCAQEVWEFGADPELDTMFHVAAASST